MQDNKNKGPRSAWTLGGLGAIIWIPILGIIFLVNGNIISAAISGGFFLGGLLYLYFGAPWRHPETSIGLLYTGLLIDIIFAAISIFTSWYYWQLEKNIIAEFDMNVFLPILVIIIINLFLPAILLANKTWDDVS